MNNSKLSTIDCYMKLTSEEPFDNMGNDDLDSIYFVGFNLGRVRKAISR